MGRPPSAVDASIDGLAGLCRPLPPWGTKARVQGARQGRAGATEPDGRKSTSITQELGNTMFTTSSWERSTTMFAISSRKRSTRLRRNALGRARGRPLGLIPWVGLINRRAGPDQAIRAGSCAIWATRHQLWTHPWAAWRTLPNIAALGHEDPGTGGAAGESGSDVARWPQRHRRP